MDEGWDIPQFIRDFREYLRQTMIEQLAQPKSPETLQIAGRPVSLAEILHIIKVMGQCVDDMRWNDNPRLVLELYSLRLTQPFVDAGDLLRRLEALEKGVSPSQTPSPLVGEVAKPAGDSPEVWRGWDGGTLLWTCPPPELRSTSPTRGEVTFENSATSISSPARTR